MFIHVMYSIGIKKSTQPDGDGVIKQNRKGKKVTHRRQNQPLSIKAFCQLFCAIEDALPILKICRKKIYLLVAKSVQTSQGVLWVFFVVVCLFLCFFWGGGRGGCV